MGTSQARNRLTDWVRHHMVLQQFETEMEFGPHTIPEAILNRAATRPGHVVLQDINQKLTFGRLCAGAGVFAEFLEPLLKAEQKRIGVLLPNVNATPLTLLSLWLMGRVPALLNYSTGAGIMLSCCQLAGLKQVVTSRAFLERAKLKLEPLTEAGIQFVYLEDLRAQITKIKKLRSLLRMTFNPKSLDCKPVGAGTAVVLFTSGSEGVAADVRGNVYGAEVGPRALKRYVKK